MLELFSTNLMPPTGNIVKFFDFENTRNVYLAELLKIDSFYKDRIYAVKGNNFLVNLLNNIDVPMQYDIYRYTNVCNIRAPFISVNMRMTSELSKGRFHNGCFYGNETLEIIVNDTDYFNPVEAERNWKNISAVKVLLHPKSDLNLLLPNGRQSSNGGGIAVISINIPLLAVQYRSFCLEQSNRQNMNNTLLGNTHFIHMYVLPGMIYSQTDVTIMNRIMNLYYHKEMSIPLLKHPFLIHGYGNKVDAVLSKVLASIEGKAMRYDNILQSIPGIVEKDMLNALLLPDYTPTIQIQWAMIVSRLSIIKFLIDVGGSISIHLNRDLINKFQIKLFSLDNNNILPQVILKALLPDITATIKEIMSI